MMLHKQDSNTSEAALSGHSFGQEDSEIPPFFGLFDKPKILQPATTVPG